MMPRILKLALCLVPAMLAVGCASNKQAAYDYTAFKAAKPRSIVVLPPLNDSPEVNAGNSVYAQVTYPLAEAGYYVLPVAVVSETFKQNGLTDAHDIQGVDPKKLSEIFGADAALYMSIARYGSTYTVIDSVSVVSVKAKLVDLKTGTLLWEGAASASSNEGNNNGGGGLIGALVAAAVKQIINSSTDASHPIAGVANSRLLSAGSPNGLLYGPRSERYLAQ
ncbi:MULTISPECIES: DUF799 domain-containing protein [unclassified Janthinobacterium]|uniref:DUF799 domain-containing protein n=1 Tax=unclassified Janthinobacterium TaxID=2610881 RepID=UPI00160F4C87|nr:MULTISPECIES: DUF799 domain-containing protein [unclassified Janthinobacterium]MBB5370058.1 hypothetical protein [Janthinobacterium sp. K2C7]MBB5382864.1 hypothetical protein [Janthinobacterium sp. K2Li3]MBB5384849.1 hypothetical protein [Janthinobacterium sp. K2E3]